MRKAVQNPRPFAELLNRQTVIFLVQEKSGFLPVLHINDILHAVFHNRNICVKFLPDKALHTLHPLVQANLCVAPLINAADHNPVLRQHLF